MWPEDKLDFSDIYEIDDVYAPHASGTCSLCANTVKMREKYYRFEVTDGDQIFAMCQDCYSQLETFGEIEVQGGGLRVAKPPKRWYNNARVSS